MNFRSSVLEFLAALRDSHTYAITRNAEALFGFLWGIPVPIFALGIHVYAANMECCLASFGHVLLAHPVYFVFIAHPFLFAIVFGALGSMRLARDQKINALVNDVEKRCEELCVANTRLQEMDRLKTEFLANVTHELKSPLVTALGYTDRILGLHLGEINERQTKGLEVSKRNLVRLRALIDEILDFSRLDAGAVKLEMTPTNFSEVISAAVENLTLKAHERKIELLKTLPGPAWISGDPLKLSQVATNLIDNAIKFSRDGGKVTATVSPEGEFWHLCIEDQGQGIPAAALPKLFERFVQADGTLGRPHNGVGLGLVIVKKIVELHGGKIWIESTENVGTKVHVQLPMGSAPATAANSAKEDERKEVAHATNIAY